MILTVTPNPCLDRTYEIPSLDRGEVIRATGDRVDPGGKGVNVSRAVAAAGRRTVAVLPLGGAPGAARRGPARRAGHRGRAGPGRRADPLQHLPRRARRHPDEDQRTRTRTHRHRGRSCSWRRYAAQSARRLLDRLLRQPAARPRPVLVRRTGRPGPRRRRPHRPGHLRTGPARGPARTPRRRQAERRGTRGGRRPPPRHRRRRGQGRRGAAGAGRRRGAGQPRRGRAAARRRPRARTSAARAVDAVRSNVGAGDSSLAGFLDRRRQRPRRPRLRRRPRRRGRPAPRQRHAGPGRPRPRRRDRHVGGSGGPRTHGAGVMNFRTATASSASAARTSRMPRTAPGPALKWRGLPFPAAAMGRRGCPGPASTFPADLDVCDTSGNSVTVECDTSVRSRSECGLSERSRSERNTPVPAHDIPRAIRVRRSPR